MRRFFPEQLVADARRI